MVCSYVAVERMLSTINQASGSSLNCNRVLAEWSGVIRSGGDGGTCLVQGGLGSFLLFGNVGRQYHGLQTGRYPDWYLVFTCSPRPS